MQFLKYFKIIFPYIVILGISYFKYTEYEKKFVDSYILLTSQEKQIEELKIKVNLLSEETVKLNKDLTENNLTRDIETKALIDKIKVLEAKVNQPIVQSNISGNKRFEFFDKQVNRVGEYETKGQVLVAWKDDYLTTQKVDVNTIGEINLTPKIEKVNKKEFVSYIDETYLGGITIRGRGEIQQIEPPRNQLSIGPFVGVAYNATSGLTEPIIGIGVSYNLIKLWDWR